MMAMDYAAILHRISIIALPVLIAITFHEAAHGYVAWRRGITASARATSPFCLSVAWRAWSACPTSPFRNCGWRWRARR